MGSLMEIRRRMMANDILPPKYQRVEFVIGNSSGSVFDTGVSGDNENLRIVFCAETNLVASYYGFFGNYVDENTDCWRVITHANSSPLGFYVTRGEKAGSSQSLFVSDTFADYTNRKLYFDISANRTMLACDGYESVRLNRNGHGSANNTNIGIGNSSMVGGGAGAIRKKYYYFRIYDGTKLIRNYIPCYRKSDNKAGMYDLVNHTFNPSTGAADFIIPS